MPHLDEGQLHAYLDRAIAEAREREAIEGHLADCAECRAQLESARVLRERAQGILQHSGPTRVERPPFDELVARARVRKGTQASRLSTLRMLGLAASLVAAAALGWFARSSMVPTQQPAPVVANRAVAPAAADTSAASTAEADERERPSVPPKRTVAQAKPLPTAPASGAVTSAARAQEPPTATAPSPSVAEEAKAADALTGRPAAPPTARREASGLAVSSALVARDSPSDLWQTVSAAAAADHLGREPAAIPSLDVLRYEMGHLDGRPAVRLVQGAPGTPQVELIERLVGADLPLEAAVRSDSTRALTVRRGDLMITATSGLAEDSLRKLLGTIRRP